MKAMTRKELAVRANVSVRTVYRWLEAHEKELQELGMEPRKQLLPPKVARWICDHFGIDHDE